MLDTLGQDPVGVEKTMDYLRIFVKNGGTAILLDNHTDGEAFCDKYYKVKPING